MHVRPRVVAVHLFRRAAPTPREAVPIVIVTLVDTLIAVVVATVAELGAARARRSWDAEPADARSVLWARVGSPRFREAADGVVGHQERARRKRDHDRERGARDPNEVRA